MRAGVAVVWMSMLVACGDDGAMTGPDAGSDPVDAMGSPDAPAGDPTAEELRAAIASCTKIGGDYARDGGSTPEVPICSVADAVFWISDLDVDCDGKTTPQCNIMTDPSYQDQTAASDSNGDPLDAAALPYVVVPIPTTRWDYRASDLMLGSVVAVVHGDKVEYGVIGDVGPSTIIGEASYAMAEALGIDPDPSTGGTDDDVAYIAFPGTDTNPIEDHAMARMIGIAAAKSLVGRP